MLEICWAQKNSFFQTCVFSELLKTIINIFYQGEFLCSASFDFINLTITSIWCIDRCSFNYKSWGIIIIYKIWKHFILFN